MATSDTDQIHLALSDVEALAYRALVASNTSEVAARSMATAITAAEADGSSSHGLSRLPTYCAHAKSGKVKGRAIPSLKLNGPAALMVDAHEGFAHPAIDVGFEQLFTTTKRNGISALAVTNSYNCGVLGYHVERLADQGLIGLAFVNTPAAIAPWGGSKALFGTNPIACSLPCADRSPIVIDQSSSVVARGEVMMHRQQGKPIPLGWALDRDGKPTTNPDEALCGSMLPTGGYKGAGLALIVEIMAALLTGANFSQAASSFIATKGDPPRTGQLFIALDPLAFAGVGFALRANELVGALLAQPGARLPGDKRLAKRAVTKASGIHITCELLQAITAHSD